MQGFYTQHSARAITDAKNTHKHRRTTGGIQAERNRSRVMMKKIHQLASTQTIPPPTACKHEHAPVQRSKGSAIVTRVNGQSMQKKVPQVKSTLHRESKDRTHLLILSLMLSQLSCRGSLRQRQADLDWHARNVSHIGGHDRICDCAITRNFQRRWEHMCYLFQNGRKSQTRHWLSHP